MTPAPKHAPKHRWFRFSLRFFLFAVAFGPPLIYWSCRQIVARSAKARLTLTEQLVRDERLPWDYLFADSTNLRDNQLAIPFSNKVEACRSHADRMATARRRLAGMIATDSDTVYWPRANAAYTESLQRLRDVAGDAYASRVRAQHDAEFPSTLKEAGWGYTEPPKTDAREP